MSNTNSKHDIHVESGQLKDMNISVRTSVNNLSF